MKLRTMLLLLLLGSLLGTLGHALPALAQGTDLPTDEVRVVYFTSPLCSFCLQVEECQATIRNGH